MMRRNKVADRGAELPFGVHRGEIARREWGRTTFVRFHAMWSTSDVQLRFFPASANNMFCILCMGSDAHTIILSGWIRGVAEE